MEQLPIFKIPSCVFPSAILLFFRSFSHPLSPCCGRSDQVLVQRHGQLTLEGFLRINMSELLRLCGGLRFVRNSSNWYSEYIF